MRSTGVVLQPYSRSKAGARFRPVLLLFLIAYSIFTGAGVAILPPSMLFLLATPIALAFGAVVWLLPNVNIRLPVTALSSLLLWFIAVNCLWPNYIAINLPGLPWINPIRIIVLAMFITWIYCLSVSSQLRDEIKRIFAAASWLRGALIVFWLTTVITLPMSGNPLFTLTRWANNQVYWTFFLVFAAWIGTRRGVITSVTKVIVWSAILVSIEAIYEYSIGGVPWAGHVPPWLIGDPQLAAVIMKSHARAGTEVYRATGTFNVSLTFAEYLAIVYPFIIHTMVKARNMRQRGLLILGLFVVLCAMWLTNARSGMIGFFLAVLCYGGFAAVRHWRRNKHSLLGISLFASIPIIGLMFLVLVFTWPRLHNMTIGGGQHQASSDARDAQWAMGRPKIFANPVGHGAGQSGTVLGYKNLAGVGTIDSYYLSVLLEYGIIGFSAFISIFLGQIILSMRVFFTTADPEEEIIGPMGVALLNFVVIKAVLSSEFNMPVAFILVGFIISLAYRSKVGSAVQDPPAHHLVSSRDVLTTRHTPLRGST